MFAEVCEAGSDHRYRCGVGEFAQRSERCVSPHRENAEAIAMHKVERRVFLAQLRPKPRHPEIIAVTFMSWNNTTAPPDSFGTQLSNSWHTAS